MLVFHKCTIPVVRRDDDEDDEREGVGEHISQEMHSRKEMFAMLVTSSTSGMGGIFL